MIAWCSLTTLNVDNRWSGVVLAYWYLKYALFYSRYSLSLQYYHCIATEASAAPIPIIACRYYTAFTTLTCILMPGVSLLPILLHLLLAS